MNSASQREVLSTMYAHAQRRYETDDSRWQAVLDRDVAAEGEFYYAVESTGVFCRPSCPARRPRRELVRFYSTPEAAQAAGFRPCLRCRPTMIAADQQLVARVQQHLDSAESPITLAELGHIVGVSPFHLQRVFRRATGLTPREYAATRRLGRLKQSLRQAPTVTEALYEAGYGSSRALYAEARAQLGMTPRAYRRGGTGEHIAYAVVDSPVGPMLVAATDQGICALRFGERDSLVRDLHAEYSSAILTEDSPRVAGYARAILDHFEGNRTLLDLPLDPGGTAFQQRVWAALREIPPGETRSYQEVAAAIGQPSAVRAVAHACATNPVALLVPCHRVLRSDGALGGYRWGLERKQALLTQERAKHRPT